MLSHTTSARLFTTTGSTTASSRSKSSWPTSYQLGLIVEGLSGVEEGQRELNDWIERWIDDLEATGPGLTHIRQARLASARTGTVDLDNLPTSRMRTGSGQPERTRCRQAVLR